MTACKWSLDFVRKPTNCALFRRQEMYDMTLSIAVASWWAYADILYGRCILEEI
jgi:hypothetical protein